MLLLNSYQQYFKKVKCFYKLYFFDVVDIDDPLGDLLLSDDENQKPKAKDKPLTTSATNVTSRTDQKNSAKGKPSLMDDLLGNTAASSKSDTKIMMAPSKPLSGLGEGLAGSANAKVNESERYINTKWLKCRN